MKGETKRNGAAKLVAAIAVFAVLFSGAFILAGTDDVSATAGSSTIPTGEVTADATYTLKAEDANKTASISLENNTGTKVTVTINYTVETKDTPMFRGGTISVGNNVKLVLNMTYAGTGSIHSNMVVNTSISLTGNGEVVFKESSNIEGQAWWDDGAASTTLTMEDSSKLTFDGANGFSGIAATLTDTSQIDMKFSPAKTWMNFRSLSDEGNTKIISSDSKAGVYFSSETTVKGTVDAKDSEVCFTTGSNTVNGKIYASTVTIGNGVTIAGKDKIDANYTASNINDVAEILETEGISEVTLTGNSVLANDITIPENKTLNIVGGTITGDKTITVEGTLSIDNSYIYVGVDVVEDKGDFVAKNTHKLTSTGTLNSDTYVGFGDELTLSGTVPAGINVYAFGKLIVNDLTVNGAVNAYIGSDVVIDGKVTVANKFIMNNAKLNLTGTIEVKNDKNGGASFELVGESELTVAESGSFRVLKGTANSAAVNKLVIGATERTKSNFIVEGTLDVTGTLKGTVEDKGTINFNGTSDDATVIVYDGIEFSPVSVTGKMTVSTKEIVKDIDEGATNVADGSTVELNDVKGVKIVSSVDVKKNKNGTAKFYFCNLTVSGTFTAVSKDATASVKVTAENTGLLIDDSKKYATITVADAVALGENVTFTNAGALTVDGTITAVNKNAAIDNTSGEITVNGLITVKIGTGNASITEGTINSVEYTITDSEGTVTQYYSGFAAAVDAIATADEKTITVKNDVTASADAEIPADAIIAVDGTLTVKAGSTLTVADGAVMNVTGTVKVGGTLVIANTDTGLTIGTLVYEVYSENGKTATYTSLANALKNAKEGDVITLSGNVTFSSDAEIPAGVTVNVGKNKVTLEEDVTLTVNGTLNFAKNSELDVGSAADEDLAKDIVANGVISFYNVGTVASALAAMDIEGACFELKNVRYISNVAYAAENCNEGDIVIYGNVVAGDVTFKAADGKELSVLVVNNYEVVDEAYVYTDKNEMFKAGKVTLDGAALLLGGKMTGTVAAQADGSEAVITLDAASGIIIESGAEDGVDGKVDYMYLMGDVYGKVTVSSGKVTVCSYIFDEESSVDDLATGTEKTDLLTVASGATLDVPAGRTLTIEDNETIGLIVDGTLNVIGTMDVNGKAVINGTMTVLNDDVTIYGELSVIGTLEMKDKTGDIDAGEVTVIGVLSVGQKTASVGAAGTVIGAVDTSTSSASDAIPGFVKVYPGADVSAAKIDWNPATEVSDAISMDFTVNGTVYMTIYTDQTDLKIYDIIKTEEFDITGVVNGELTSPATGLYKVDSWFTSEEMKESQKLTDEDKINKDVPAVYAYAAAASVSGTITQGTGLELFIDGAKYNGERSLTVGTHTVSLGIKAGYDGTNASITFNGATVTDGKIVITADMTSFTLVASGAVPASSAVVVDDKDDGMGLTDILLVVLVVLIAVMAIMVALRMMRS